jgi:hypothetical protein
MISTHALSLCISNFFIPVGSILAEHQDYLGNAKVLLSSVMLEVLLYTDSMNVIKFIMEVNVVGHSTRIQWWDCFVSFIVKFSLLEISWNNKASSLPTCIKLARTSTSLGGVFITKGSYVENLQCVGTSFWQYWLPLRFSCYMSQTILLRYVIIAPLWIIRL